MAGIPQGCKIQAHTHIALCSDEGAKKRNFVKNKKIKNGWNTNKPLEMHLMMIIVIILLYYKPRELVGVN